MSKSDVKTWGGILLSGGKSRRMDSDKASILVKGKPMAEWSAELLKSFCSELIVSSNNSKHSIYGDTLVKDSIGEGPLAGIYASLLRSEHDYNIVLACDTPFVSLQVIERLIEASASAKAVIAVDGNGKVHPLIGIYHKSLVPIIQDKLEKGHFSMMRFLDEIGAKQLVFDELDAFKNINDMEALQKESNLNTTIMICGNGQNVGKTTLTQHVIRYLKERERRVCSIKTSSHMHPINSNELFLLQGEDFDIIEERNITHKDSSLHLQAGANKSFYIQCKPEYLLHCYHTVQQHIAEEAIVVCESATLSGILKPDLLLFVKAGSSEKNAHLIDEADLVVSMGNEFTEDTINTQIKAKLDSLI
ncbi:NTP transferase domain-containing protein [Saccharicrinis aurantiacus]|uniref:NTP transferase domain-containing protein n=1 Tax=Saccharicrinis aurantiacus TaxID=1849719 RepID=UPI00249129E9|nr:NTP transferase domain-containing protein [Saccharicrinis aurantiacus]